MAEAMARARYLRVSPRKLRLVADLVRGKKVEEARAILQYTVKGGAPLLAKVLASAVANAEHAATEKRERIDTDEMVVNRICVDGAPTRYKIRSAPRGRAVRVIKRSSHVQLWISNEAQAK